MKKLIVSLSLIFLVVLLIATNPSKMTHKETIKNNALEVLEEKSEKNNIFDALLGGMSSHFESTLIAQNLTVDNYFIFSLGKIKHDGENKVVSIGVLNHVFTPGIKEQIQSMKSGGDSNKK